MTHWDSFPIYCTDGHARRFLIAFWVGSRTESRATAFTAHPIGPDAGARASATVTELAAGTYEIHCTSCRRASRLREASIVTAFAVGNDRIDLADLS